MGRRLSHAALRRLLLEQPSKLDLREAAVRVIARRDGCSLSQARFGLAELRDHVVIDRYYKMLLPVEHAREKGSVASRRVNFFRAVERRFPVDWDYLDMVHMEAGNYDDEGALSAEDYFGSGIAILSMRPFESWSFSRDWDKQALVYQLADVLFMKEEWGGEQWNTARKWEHLVKKLRLDRPVKRGPDSIRTPMLRAFENARGPVRHLPAARNILAFDTGSVFFDYDPDDGAEFWEWSRTAIEFLTAQADAARRMLKQVEALENWLAADPRANARHLLNYYTRHRRILSHESRQGGDADSDARALVTVLSGSTGLAPADEGRRPV